MKYNFNLQNERSNTGSVKWNPDFYSKEFRGNKDLLPMWVADMDFKVSEGILNRLKNLTEDGIFGYCGVDDEYYSAVINWYKKVHNIEFKKDEIIFTPGVVPAVNYIIQTFTSENDSILIQPPVYYPFKNSIANNNRRVVCNPLKECPVRGYTVDYDDMEERIKTDDVKLFILCSPHNPVGRVWDADEIKRMVEICVKYGVLIVSDEIHCDLLFFGSKHITTMSVSDEAADITITCNAVSKTFNLAGLQVSNIIIRNTELREKYRQTLKKLSISTPNIFSIEAVKGAYLDSDQWYVQMLDYIQGNIEYASKYIENHIPDFSMRKIEGTYLGWIDMRKMKFTREQTEDFFENNAKVALDYGHWFGDEGEGFVRINLACTRATLAQALERIKNAMDEL